MIRIASVIGSMLHCNAAAAQNVDSIDSAPGSIFARNRTVPVADRTFPGYTYEGIKFGDATVKPSVTTGAFVTDNLYATPEDRVADASILVAPAVSIEGSRGPTSFNVAADAQINRYLSRSSENSVVYGLSSRGRHDLGSGFWVGVRSAYRHDIERRSDPGAINISVRPIEMDSLNTRVELGRERGRLRLIGGAGFAAARFASGRLADGSRLAQSYRDRDVLRADLRADYALSADLALQVKASYAKNKLNRNGDSDRLDRSSDRYELLGGASFEFTDLLRGEIALGYIQQRYKLPVFETISGFGGRAQLEYQPTRLTTLTLKASRTIEEGGLPEAPSYLRSAVSMTVDHELYRNVTLSAYASYSDNVFRQPIRSEKRPGFGASGNYRINDKISFYGRYDYLEVSARPTNPGRSFRMHTATFGMKIGL